MSFEDRYYELDIKGIHYSLPSVTSVLRIKNKEGLNIWRAKLGFEASEQEREETSEIGKEIHRYIAQLINGVSIQKLEWSLLGEEIKNGIRAYERVRVEANLKCEATEMIVYNLELGYAGTLDFVGTVYKEGGLIDWKTGKRFYPSMLAQGVAYYKALPAEIRSRIQNIYTVNLNRNTGVPDIHRLRVEDSDPYWDYFLACLNLFKCDKKLNNLTTK